MSKPRKKTFLTLYEEWGRKGRMPHAGLCESIKIQWIHNTIEYGELQLLRMINPHHYYNEFTSYDDMHQLAKEKYHTGYWGWDKKVKDPHRSMFQYNWKYRVKMIYTFTPRRQNLVLLMAALNGEFDESLSTKRNVRRRRRS